MKKTLFYLFVIWCCVLGFKLSANAGDKDIYNKAVKDIGNYDVDKGYKGMKEVIYSKTSPQDLKIKSYFWIAYIKLFDGAEDKASETFKEMLGKKIGYDYDINTLPVELSGNDNLIGIYKKEKSAYLKMKRNLEKKAAKYRPNTTRPQI